MTPSSIPHATAHRVVAVTSTPVEVLRTPSGYGSITNSWSSSRGMSGGTGLTRPPIAWAGVRHQLADNTKDDAEEEKPVDNGLVMGHCHQVVLVTCLHLSHEMALREVGLYGWVHPSPKDPSGSMLRIMKNYTQLIHASDATAKSNVRAAPDPSKTVIQHHLQKARLAAGPDSYVAVLYSGHGIQEPPTEAGELWCYDKSFDECAADGSGPSEYIPILLFDLLTWAGATTCYVWDCQHAGRFISAAKTEAAEIDSQLRAAAEQNPSVAEMHPAIYSARQIHLAACGPDQVVPKVPGLPDDLFTACLLSPLRIALLYHNLQTFPLTTSGNTHHYLQRSPNYMTLLWDNMSDHLKNRLWSELQAILHTIAWQTIQSADYQLLFGQNGDSISTMSGGFILSQRVLGTYRTQPESIPHIPSSTSHQLWTHWDLILDNFFEQLPDYFDTTHVDFSWEKSLKLVSFMEDQLGSILTSNSGMSPSSHVEGGGEAALSRLPIICQAASTPEFRAPACQALDACLQNVNLAGLDHAVHCGTLDVAVQLLDLVDPALADQMISIWASLIRHRTCIKRLCAPIKEAEMWVDVPAVKFFLERLEHHLSTRAEGSGTTIIRCAAILATIANEVPGQTAPKFIPRTLGLCLDMLQDNHPLVQQWGALLAAEVLGCLDRQEKEQDLVDALQESMFGHISSKTVETRATMIYALGCWIPSFPVGDLMSLGPCIEIASKLLDQATTDASLFVRKELAHLFSQLLSASGRWSDLAFLMYLIDRASEYKGEQWTKGECRAYLGGIGKILELEPEEKRLGAQLTKIVKIISRLWRDPDRRIKTRITSILPAFLAPLKAALGDDEGWTGIEEAAFPETQATDLWTEVVVHDILKLGERLAAAWHLPQLPRAAICAPNKDLFNKSKLSLQVYISRENVMDVLPEQLKGQPQNSQERTWILRHRVLEDSLVVAEQQIGLPWKWHMKDISAPEPWSSLTCHSFHSAVMSCNDTEDLLLWDWASSRKIGHIHIDLAPGAHIKSGRFVNELHEHTAVLAEISTGDIYVFAGPPNEPTQMKLISSFMALDLNQFPMTILDPTYKRLQCSWFRQSGLLAVGGSSRVVNIWDCPAEQLVRDFETDEDVPITTLITEPKSGNLFIAGFANGRVKLYDQRSARRGPTLSWNGDEAGREHKVKSGRAIAKVGVVLGESRTLTSACSNGLLNIHDIRSLTSPVSSILAHPSGIASASFQAHSGLMSTISNLSPPAPPTLDISGLSLTQPPDRPYANFGLYRSIGSGLSAVTEEQITFDSQLPDVLEGRFTPYTFIHPLRPFLSLGYGRSCWMRGSGVGKGDTTDSGSYSFLRAQAQFVE